jgi:hypothetical protein
MGKTRFHFDTIRRLYIRDIPITDISMLTIKIPEEGWSRKTSCAVNQWIRRNKNVPPDDIQIDTFRWGEITINKTPLHTNHLDTDSSNTVSKGFQCEKCKKMYKTRSGLLRHKYNCEADSNIIPIPTQGTTQNIVINNNIQIRNYGEENPKWLNSNVLYSVMKNIKKAIPQLMEKKHFNDEFPENKNLRINTKKDMDRMLQVFENGRWRVKDSKQTFYRVIVDIYDILSEALTDEDEDENDDKENIKDISGCVSDEVRKARKSERFLKKVEKIRPIWEEFEEKFNSSDKGIMDDLWNDLKVLLMDRHLAIEQGFE